MGKDSGPRTQPLMVRFVPPQVMPKLGENATLTLVLVGAKDVMAVDVILSYDPSMLEASDLAAGALLSLDGAAVRVERQMEYGKVRAKFARPKGVSGSGAIVSLTVKALKPGLGLVNVDGITVSTPERDESPYIGGQGRVLVMQ